MSGALFFNAVGLLGPAFFMIAFSMVSIGKWHAQMPKFHLLNLFGALTLLISLLHDWNLAVFLLESCWAVIAAYGLYKTRKKPA